MEKTTLKQPITSISIEVDILSNKKITFWQYCQEYSKQGIRKITYPQGLFRRSRSALEFLIRVGKRGRRNQIRPALDEEVGKIYKCGERLRSKQGDEKSHLLKAFFVDQGLCQGFRLGQARVFLFLKSENSKYIPI